MNEILFQYYKTPFGELVLGSLDDQLCICDWRFRKMRNSIDARICKILKANMKEGFSVVMERAIFQLEEYFSGFRKTFDLPLVLAGTDFQKRVWNALPDVEYGQTSSYLELSEKLGDKNAVRAIASANGANAISIIVPCHRIIGTSGELVGYAGGLPAKEKLLNFENPEFGQMKIAKTSQLMLEF